MNILKLFLFLYSTAGLSLTLLGDGSLSIYNDNFALVKDNIKLDLKKGINKILIDKITSSADPNTVMLRDLLSDNNFSILEQSYNSATLSEKILLKIFEGQTIDFAISENNITRIIKGKIIRGGKPGSLIELSYSHGKDNEMTYSDIKNSPIIEVDGKLIFTLPGEPRFPPLTEKQKELLYPSLQWVIESEKDYSGTFILSYITGSLSWKADYNLIFNEKDDRLVFSGWITMNNKSGKDFENTKINLMAGDIKKLNPRKYTYTDYEDDSSTKMFRACMKAESREVQEKEFDEYHLYSLQTPVNLNDGESKQVEFTKSENVKADTVFIYEGTSYNDYKDYNDSDPKFKGFGTNYNSKIGTFREFFNKKENGLGIPLPKGNIRFYRKTDSGQIEFIGENEIKHTPKDEKISIYTGDAFDIKGSRIQVSYNSYKEGADETFEIRLVNHKSKDVNVKTIENMVRSEQWQISDNSDPFIKKDRSTIEFNTVVPANSEKIIKYTVKYKWNSDKVSKIFI